MKKNFQVIVLGTDINAYNVARSFHMEYGVKSILFGYRELIPVKHSKICKTIEVDEFYKDEVMIKTLVDYAKENQDKDLILFAASENYVYRIFKNEDVLGKYYLSPYIDAKMGMYLSEKMNFYKECEKHNLPYPKVKQVNRDNYKEVEKDFTYPIILKPIESAEYFTLNFEGKEKVYILENTEELDRAIKNIYDHNYKHDMLMQEYIAGDPTNEYSMNIYCDKNSVVRSMSLGQIVIPHPKKEMRGNNIAIMHVKRDERIEKLIANTKSFLKAIKFKGLANFDFKWDEVEQEFKALDFNLRQGRTSFYSTLSGANYGISVLDDIYDIERDLIYGDREFLWLNCTTNFLKDVYSKINPDKYEEIKAIKNVDTTITYDFDKSFKRNLIVKRYLRNNDKMLKESFKTKGEQ